MRTIKNHDGMRHAPPVQGTGAGCGAGPARRPRGRDRPRLKIQHIEGLLVLLLAPGPGVQAGEPAPPIDSAGWQVHVAATVGHWTGPASAFAAFGDRASYTIEVAAPMAGTMALVAFADVLPAEWRLGAPPPCTLEGYDGLGEPSSGAIAGAAACTAPKRSLIAGAGPGWRFRIGPRLRAVHALVACTGWLRDLVVPLDTGPPDTVGIAPVLAAGPGIRTRFAWTIPRTPLELGLRFHAGVLAADVGPVIQFYLPIAAGFDVGLVSSRPPPHPGDPVRRRPRR